MRMNSEIDPHSARARELALKISTTPEAASEWFTRPAPALDGHKPNDLLATDAGPQEIEDLLN